MTHQFLAFFAEFQQSKLINQQSKPFQHNKIVNCFNQTGIPFAGVTLLSVYRQNEHIAFWILNQSDVQS